MFGRILRAAILFYSLHLHEGCIVLFIEGVSKTNSDLIVILLNRKSQVFNRTSFIYLGCLRMSI